MRCDSCPQEAEQGQDLIQLNKIFKWTLNEVRKFLQIIKKDKLSIVQCEDAMVLFQRKVILLLKRKKKDDNMLESLIKKIISTFNQKYIKNTNIVSISQALQNLSTKLAKHNPAILPLNSKPPEIDHQDYQNETERHRLNYISNLQNRRHPEIDCLCCTTFFYEGMNIKDERINKQCFKTYLLSEQYTFEAQLPGICQQICAFLNTNGGVILLSCLSQDTQTVRIKDYKFTQTAKQYYKQQLFNNFKVIPDQDSYKLEVDFVPIAKNPLQSLQFEFLPIAYTMRIKAIVLRPQQVIYLITDNKPSLWVLAHGAQHDVKELKNQALYLFMKKRYNQYTTNIGGLAFNPPKQTYHLVDKCKTPQTGLPETGQPIIVKNVDQKRYKYISLLVLSIDDMPSIRKELDELKLDYEINSMPQTLRLSQTTFLIHHQMKFEKIEHAVKKANSNNRQDNQRNSTKQQIKLISSCKSLQILSNFSQQQWELVSAWYKYYFNKDIQYTYSQNKKMFLICDETIQAIYLFFLFNQVKVSVKFQKFSHKQTNNMLKT